MTVENGSSGPQRIEPWGKPDLEEIRAGLDAMVVAHRQTVHQERMSAFREMAGELAHGFTETLSGILARAQILLDDARDPQVLRSVRMIEQVALEGTRMVRRLQDFSRTRPAHPFQAVDLNQLVVEIVTSIRGRWNEQLAERGISGDVKAETAYLPLVAGDPAELRHALTSIALNALDAMPDGGKLTFRTGIDGPRVFCRITDTGVGMSDDVRQRIFDPFFTTKPEKSPGFGLSGVHAIVGRHGGEIVVESEVDKGTTFAIWLPVAKTREVAPEQPILYSVPAAVAPPLKLGAQILVVDDSEEVREVLRELLDRFGHTVVTCPDSASALVELERQSFDAVFVDLTLPGISGLEVASRAKQRWPGATVAIITGHVDGIDPDEARAKGIEFVVSKPFRLDEVRSIVDHATGGARL
jgi:CheY-like chemotaxis protein